MNYSEARKFVEETTKYGSILGLDTIKTLLGELGNPQDKVKIVHVAGTNGKGSVFTFVQNVLLQAGYHVGRYASPAVFEYREIIQFDGKNITEEEFAKYITTVNMACERMVRNGKHHPTSFEVETALAYLYFSNKPCDIVLIETGMGGETDATNVEKEALCSVITSISLDHMQFLGETIEEIARVKSGIIKENSDVVVSNQDESIINVIKSKVEIKNSKVVVANEPYNIKIDGYITSFDYVTANDTKLSIKISMMGAYQLINACTAIETLEVLRNKGYNISDENIIEGMKNAKWPGRMEIINESPLIVIDGAHNPGAAVKLKESIEMYFTNKRIAFIMGVLADKDYSKEIKIVAGLAKKIFTITPDNKRALNGKALALAVADSNKNVIFEPTLEEAVKEAEKLYRNNEIDMILAFGSLSYLGDLKNIINDANS